MVFRNGLAPPAILLFPCRIPRSAYLFLACIGAFGFAPAATIATAADGASVLNPRFTGSPFMRMWAAEDYGGPPGNQCVVQHPGNGFIYVGNNSGVIEFDGTRWRLIRLLPPLRSMVRTMAIDRRGRIWTANDDTICCLTPDANGELRATSVAERLPVAERNFRSAFANLAGPRGIYVVAAERLFFFGDDDGAARVWPMPGSGLALRMWWADGSPYWQMATREVYRLRGDEIERVANQEQWLGTLAVAATPPLAALLAGITARGDEGAIAAAPLADGRLAIGTAREGLLVYDHAGKLAQRLDRTSGLASNRIEGLCEDNEGGVWLAMRNGLARVQLDSPYALHGPAQHFDGNPIDLGLYRGELFVAATEGLARRDAAGRFHFFENLPGAPRRIVPYEDRLYIGGARLQLVLPDGQTRTLDSRQYMGLVPLSTARGVFAYGTPGGLWLGRAEGETWQRLGRCTAMTGQAVVLAEHPAGIVWVVNASSGLWRVDFTAGAKLDAPARNFGGADGLVGSLQEFSTRVFRLGDSLEVISRGKLFRYDAARDRFEPETRIAGLPAPADAIALGAAGPGGTAFLQTPPPARQTYQVQPDGPDRWRATLLSGAAQVRFAAIELLPDALSHTLWSGGAGALLSQDLDWRPSRAAPALQAWVRRIESADGAVLWDSAGGAPPPAFAPTQNALRFVSAAPSYNADHQSRTHTVFRTRLEGLDADWSKWSARGALRDFTNLPYRDFKFRVQAREDDGRISPEALVAFTILPPWWLTRWAWTGYALLGLSGVAGIVTLRTRALRQRAVRLEKTVAERTAELASQNVELARLRQLELDEKTAAQLAEQKTRLEMLRYQLNPHFLFNSLNSIGAQTVRRPEVAREMMYSLSEFCRLALHRGDGGTDATVSAEIEMLKSYLAIEQARRGDAMQVEIDVTDAAATCALPPFLLLPLVENAVKYGSRTSEERLEIRLRARLDSAPGESLVLEVSNSGRWVDEAGSAPGYGGIGLKNLRERLGRHYPGAHEFTTSTENGTVIARVVLHAPPLNLAVPASSQNPGPSSQDDRRSTE